MNYGTGGSPSPSAPSEPDDPPSGRQAVGPAATEMAATADMEALRAFFAAPAPRSVPRGMKTLALNAVGGFDNSPRAWFFWVVILVSLWIAGLLFLPWRYPVELLVRLGWNRSAPAVVTRYEKSGFAIGGDSERNIPGVPVFRVYFSLDAGEFGWTEAANYYLGERRIPGWGEGVFDENGVAKRTFATTALYAPFSPEYALLPGGRLSTLPPYAALVMIFPLLFTFLFAVRVRKRRRALAMFRDGLLTEAEVVSCEETGMRVNGRSRHKVTLRAADPYGEAVAVVSVYGQAAESYRRLAGTGGKVPVLRLPTRSDLLLPLVDASGAGAP